MSNYQIAHACSSSDDDNSGIYSYKLTERNGDLQVLNQYSLAAPTYLAIHPEETHLYSTDRGAGGRVTAFRISESPGELIELNSQSSGGEGATHISVDSAGEYAFVANYTSGSISILPIESDGKLSEPTDIVAHDGSSVNPDRQSEPHPHAIGPGPDDQFVYVPDLGTDTVEIYEVDSKHDTFNSVRSSPARLQDGAGPRHFDFHPNGLFAYVINELNSTISVFNYDPNTGALNEIETVSTLPAGFNGNNYCAGVQVHPSGEWLYGTNRGHDSIFIASIDGQSGQLETVGYEDSRGEWPWDLSIDSTGSFLVVANRDSNSLVSYEIDNSTGKLAATGHEQTLPQPICVMFQ